MSLNENQVVNSALWSAYGDALGFITELAGTPAIVHRRTGTNFVKSTVSWTRRVGGRFGVDCLLPAGCYSDDTQLRLATSRAIRADGSFDVESFAKMELPIWSSYALGAGRASKAAAASLAKNGVTWYSNFFRTENIDYVQSGGNGAAMRIQPHIWSAQPGQPKSKIILDIFKNSICSHGHVRGILGAVFHGLCIGYSAKKGAPLDLSEMNDLVRELSDVPEVLQSDHDLRLLWLPVWEQRSKINFCNAWDIVQEEMLVDFSILSSIKSAHPDQKYTDAVHLLDGFSDAQRGSGTKTAILAAYLAHVFGTADIEASLICAANLLGSDTDSIATMAGAILGINSNDSPKQDISDREYIVSSAKRLYSISAGHKETSTRYPDLLGWVPPKAQLDSVVASRNGLEILVLGKVVHEGEIFDKGDRDEGFWQWLELEMGQKVLLRRRRNPQISKEKENPPTPVKTNPPPGAKQENDQMPLFKEGLADQLSIDDLTKSAIHSGFDPKLIGEHILSLSARQDGVERAIAYAAIVAKARMARRRI